MRTGSIVAVTALILWFPLVNSASCTIQDSEDTCKEKILGEFAIPPTESPSDVKDAAQDALKAFAEQLSAKNTGGVDSTTSEVASSFSDFFTLLKVSGDSGSTEASDDQAVAFELTRCIPGSPGLFGVGEGEPTKPDIDGDTRLQCQVRVRAGGATLYEPIKQGLAESVRDARSKELEEKLDFGDSLSVGVFVNLVGDNWGRVPRFASEPLFTDIWNVVFEKESSFHAASREADEAYEDLREAIEAETGAELKPDTKFSEIRSVDLATRAIKAREDAWRAEFRSMDNVRRILRSARYLDLVDLVNNQPQLNLGVEYTQHDALAGPDEWRAKVVYERGIVNVNSARAYTLSAHCKGSDLSSRDAAARLSCFNEYLEDPRTQKRLKGGDRFAFSLEAVHRKKYRLALPIDGVDVKEDAQKSVIGSLAYGCYIAFDKRGDATSRIDLKASYEDVTNDKARHNRGLGIATLTQRVFGKHLIALSVVYATKPEYRGDVDKELSARLGFNYKWGTVAQ